MSSTLKEDGLRGGERGKAKRASLGNKKARAGRSFQEDLESLGFTLSLAKLKWEMRLEDEEPAHKMTG